MIDEDVKAQFKNLDDRLARVEQFLPTVATKDDLKAFPTRDEMHESAATTRAHFDVIAESLRDEIRMALEGHVATTSRIETLEHGHGRLDRRVTALEARASAKRRK